MLPVRRGVSAVFKPLRQPPDFICRLAFFSFLAAFHGQRDGIQVRDPKPDASITTLLDKLEIGYHQSTTVLHDFELNLVTGLYLL